MQKTYSQPYIDADGSISAGAVAITENTLAAGGERTVDQSDYKIFVEKSLVPVSIELSERHHF